MESTEDPAAKRDEEGGSKRRRGLPKLDATFFVQREDIEYAARQRRAQDALQTYAKRVYESREQVSIATEGALPCITLSGACRATATEKIGIVKAVVPERGFVKQVLTKRCPTSIGIKPDQSFIVRYENGVCAAVVMRNVVSNEIAAACHTRALQIHRATSLGWTWGCEADPHVACQRMKVSMHRRRRSEFT